MEGKEQFIRKEQSSVLLWPSSKAQLEDDYLRE